MGLSRPFRFFTSHRSARPVSLATTPRVSFDFLSCSYLDVSIHCVRFNNLCIQSLMTLVAPGCPIRISSDHSSFSAPQGFSQSTTSFFASHCQGIHQMPFSSWFSLCVCLILSTKHTVRISTNLRVLLELFMSYSYPLINSIFICKYFKDLIYITRMIYTRYTSYSLCPNITLIYFIKDPVPVPFLPLEVIP